MTISSGTTNWRGSACACFRRVRALALTGCRRGEIINLKGAEVEVDRSCLRLQDSKEGASIRLADLRGKVVVLEAFQMLCPGCAQVGLPQLARVREQFAADDVAVLGLHSVFEHHEAQGSRAPLEAFLHEYRYAFPVDIDRPGEERDGVPNTMRAYNLQGTRTLVLIDRQGRLRRQVFGHLPDLRLGAEIMALVAEPERRDAQSV